MLRAFCYLKGSTCKPRKHAQALPAFIEAALKLLHPFMPHVTEYLWQKLFTGAGDAERALMTEAYPALEGAALARDARRVGAWDVRH